MLPKLNLHRKLTVTDNLVLVIRKLSELPPALFQEDEQEYLTKRFSEKETEMVSIHRLGKIIVVFRNKKGKTDPAALEKWRRKGDSLLALVNEYKIGSISLYDQDDSAREILALAEGLLLGNYQFNNYRKDAATKESSLQSVEIISKSLKKQQVEQLYLLCESVYRCRSLVNEPLSALDATGLAAAFETMGNLAGIKVEILNKQKIEALKMGGLLAVNRGSLDPPTFTIMEYKPGNAVNRKPLVFVGKGVVYDTGGLSLKPTSGMDTMKCDMAGSAAAAGAIYAIARAGLPLHVVALMPATDNRPDGNAYVPGDIIRMMDGTSVEVLNTDAEGRLILADALVYAKKYDPMLVIDLATLTGAAAAAIGKYGIAGMHARAAKYMENLKEAGNNVHERIAEFPFWEEYADLIKSDIADLKNIGGPVAGAITAGKFLQHFTSYPWIHLDIAGPAFLDKKDGYRTAGGTGVGIRLLFELASQLVAKKV